MKAPRFFQHLHVGLAIAITGDQDSLRIALLVQIRCPFRPAIATAQHNQHIGFVLAAIDRQDLLGKQKRRRPHGNRDKKESNHHSPENIHDHL